jgi:hypothetical protein
VGSVGSNTGGDSLVELQGLASLVENYALRAICVHRIRSGPTIA